MFSTVQDLGRYGYGPLGVSASGAADPLALRIGNRIVGNRENAAALEMTLVGGAFAFPDGATIALAGSDFSSPVPMWTATRIEPGGVLKLGPTRSGARCYLCVAGGVDVPLLLGSASTHVLTGLGGFEGRALRKGDMLKIGEPQGLPRSIDHAIIEQLAPRKILRATLGPQSSWFSRESLELFFSSSYEVTEETNRMGLRLTGAPLETPHSGHMTSEGVSLGAVQIPHGGQPIILFVEQQTTGGYPKIANVISADLASLGQLRPRDQIRFARVDAAAARELLLRQRRVLAALSSS